MSTLLIIPTMVFVLIKASMLGGRNLVSHLTTTNRMVMGRISIEMSPLRNIIRDQVGKKIHATDKLLENIKIHATDKLLENINAKMDNFTVEEESWRVGYIIGDLEFWVTCCDR
jgi:hypothetical protein